MSLDAELVSEHLDRTLASPLFRKAERQARFLRFVVSTALSSPDASLKEFDIGMAVYDRRSDFDPRADPIVRVEAARLRARLREYYETTPPDGIKIELPKGGYIPQFVVVNEPGPLTAQSAAPGPVAGRSINVQPFRSLSSNAEHRHFCDGLTEETLHRLAQDGRLTVIGQGALTRFQGDGAVPQSRYLLEASVRHAGDDIRLTLHLIDLADGRTCLSKVYKATITDIFASQDKLADQIHADVAAIAGGGRS